MAGPEELRVVQRRDGAAFVIDARVEADEEQVMLWSAKGRSYQEHTQEMVARMREVEPDLAAEICEDYLDWLAGAPHASGRRERREQGRGRKVSDGSLKAIMHAEDRDGQSRGQDHAGQPERKKNRPWRVRGEEEPTL